jgi:antitoxin (DNA-binding transcriptional repressor) of toxin-antitoxin stability system
MDEKSVTSVGLRELSNALSSFVRKASMGWRVLITDRGRVIAEICKADMSRPGGENPLLYEWEAQGALKRGSGKKRKFPRGAEVLAGQDVGSLLDDLRGER